MSIRYFDRRRFLNDLAHADLGQVTAKPVFILGLHRSGTTFLYQMLAGSFDVAILTASHLSLRDPCSPDFASLTWLPR